MDDYVVRVKSFNAWEVDDAVNFFHQMLNSGVDFDRHVLKRMIAVSILLKWRAINLYNEFANLGDDESICDNGVRDVDLAQLYQNSSMVLRDACKTWVPLFGTVTDLQREAGNCFLFPIVFSIVLPAKPLKTLSVAQFETLLSNYMKIYNQGHNIDGFKH